MTCPKEDELLAFVDDMLENSEKELILRHLHGCMYCQQQVEVLHYEQEALKETLIEPALNDDFADIIVAGLQPYEKKRTRIRPWKYALGTAAGLILAAGITFSVSPSFAELLGGIFRSDRVDEGLQLASNTELAERVNIAVEDQGITLQVEELIVDASRIAFSYKITNKSGKMLDPYLESDDTKNTITLHNEKGEEIGPSSWSNADDHGVVEFSLHDIEPFMKGFIRMDTTEISGKTGNWRIEVPVDLTAAYAKQVAVEIDESYEVDGVEIELEQAKYSTSTTEIFYSMAYTEGARQEMLKDIEEKGQQFSKEIATDFIGYHPRIGYRIEDEQGQVKGYYNLLANEERGHPVDLNMIGGYGKWEGDYAEVGKTSMVDTFVPEQEEEHLYFVLDTIYKTKTSDFSVTFNTEELPYTFEYNGYELTIDSVERETDYSLQKSWKPVRREVTTRVKLSGHAEQKAPDLAGWALEDANGTIYQTFSSGATLDETDDQGRFKREIELISYDLQKVPKELTLHLIAETEAIKLDKEWRVPLFK